MLANIHSNRHCSIGFRALVGRREVEIANKEASAERLRRLVVVLTFLAIFTMAVRVSVDSDTWWHLRAGRWILEHGRILTHDPFSLTRQGQAWVYPGWLAQLLLFGFFQLGGYGALNLLTAFMVFLAFLFLWGIMEGSSLAKAFTVLLAAAASGVYWSARPQILSFTLTAIFLWVLEKKRRENPRWLVSLPLLLALWTNLHGGFAIGILLLIVYLCAEVLEGLLLVVRDRLSVGRAWEAQRRSLLHLGVSLAFTVLAVGANPHGFAMLVYPFKTVSVGVLQDYIQEWQSPNFHRLETQPFLWMLIGTFIAFAASSKPRRVVEVLLVVGFAYMSFMAGRNIALFALAAAPALLRHGTSALEPLLAERSTGPQVPEAIARWLNAALILLAFAAAILKIQEPLDGPFNESAFAEQMPVAGTDYLLDHPAKGPMFNSYNWGGYVVWKLYPVYLSFVDGRTDLFDDEILEDYLRAWRAETGWREIFSTWNIQVAMLEPFAPLARELEWQGWESVYRDGLVVILQKPEESG